MRRLLILGLVLGVAGCAVTDRVGRAFSYGDRTGLPFRTVLTVGDDPRDFVVTARDAGAAGVDAVRESVRHPATRHCIERFGASDIVWAIDPATGDWQRAFDGEAQVFAGRCTAR